MAKTKTVFVLLLIPSLVFGMFAGCGGRSGSAGESHAHSSFVEQSGDAASSLDGAALKYAVSGTAMQKGEIPELVELVREETGIQIELVLVPSAADAGEVDQLLVMLQAGDELDILYGTTSKLQAYYRAGALIPLDDLAAASSYNMQATYGANLPVMTDGIVCGLPAFNDIWLTIYNKQLFDDAGIAYPPLQGFTWEQYIHTAKQLTDPERGIWGSYMLDYECYNYMLATQKGAQPYKNGAANFDDPLYRESLAFFYSLGNSENIQPNAMLYASEAYSWNQFLAGGNVAMWVVGGWAASMLPQLTDHREWQAGLAPMPYPEGVAPSTLAITGCYAIPVTCNQPQAAFEAIRCMAEKQYALGYGRIPARIDLTEKEMRDYIEEKLIPTYQFDGITSEQIHACWFDAGRAILPEKIVGPADFQINQIWLEEGQLYGQNYKNAEEAIASIQERSNRAIEAVSTFYP